MAKSLRSKRVLKAKSIKRKEVFQSVQDARVARLAEKLKENLRRQKVEKCEDEYMGNDEREIKRVSTSGWRDARHLNYKRAKKLKSKKGSFTKF